MNKFINNFKDKINNLSHSEKYVFYFINDDLKRASKISLIKIAEINSVSTTTIIRMCKKLGLSGFSELKFIIKETLESDKNFLSSIDELKGSITRSVNSINLNSLQNLSREIKLSNRVIIVSVGLTKPIGEYFSKLLMQASKPTMYVYESHIIDLLEKAPFGDLIIFLSNSGETKTLTNLAQKLSYRNIKTACIVNNPDSTLWNLVTFPITTYTEKSTLNGYDITPRTNLMIVIDLIFAYYIEK